MSVSPLAAAFLSVYSKGIALGGKQAIFTGIFNNLVYDSVVNDIGYGSFQDGFLTLFSDEMEQHNECLKLWDFLLPADDATRKVIGRNAYGAMLIIERAEINGTAAVIGILDPVTVTYWSNENCLFANMLGHWLPQKKVLHTFIDNSVYAAMRTVTDITLAPEEMLAIKVPLSLGGKMEPANFQIENVHDYYTSTADIYRKLPAK